MTKESPNFFVVGDAIPATGVYQVFHGPHRVAHEVTLLQGETFPHCVVCKEYVHFKLLVAAPQIARDPSFAVRLYELPHPNSDHEVGNFEAASA